MARARVSLGGADAGMLDEKMNVDYAKVMDPYPWKSAAKRAVREATDATGERPATLLDVCCGPGHLLTALATVAPDIELHGLDVSEHMLGLARQRLVKAGAADSVRLHQASAYEMPFEDGSFDAVLCTDALHCFDDLAPLFTELARVAGPRGVVIVHSWRRDAFALVRIGGYLHTAALKAMGSALSGGGPIFDASWTPEEVRDAAAGCAGVSCAVKPGTFEMVTMLRRVPATS